MINLFFAAEEPAATGIGVLGINPVAFIVQLISFIIVFLLLKKFAFSPIVKLLSERHKVIDDGVRMGMRMEKEKAKLDEQVAETMRDARHKADQIIADANKEARQVVHDAEKAAQHKVNLILADADARIEEDAAQARKKLEKDIVGLVSEATEAIVGEKIDSQRDAELVAKALKGQKK